MNWCFLLAFFVFQCPHSEVVCQGRPPKPPAKPPHVPNPTTQSPIMKPQMPNPTTQSPIMKPQMPNPTTQSPIMKPQMPNPTTQSSTMTPQVSDLDKYRSYLDYPRLTFSGYFRADTPTLNNFVINYDFQNLEWGDVNPVDNWQPFGSGEWGIAAKVTSVCYADGDCISEEGTDPVIGMSVTDGGIGSPGKMSALDVQVETFACEIWGWSVQVGDLFSGAFNTTGAQYLWRKVPNGTNDDPYRGAVYQSVLTDITWIDSKYSRVSQFTQELQHITEGGSGELSMKFNLDVISEESGAKLGVGRVTGTIGASGLQAPPFFTVGRMLKSEEAYVQDAPFKVDDVNKRLIIDVGNSLPITMDGNVRKDLLGTLKVALPRLNDTAEEACSQSALDYIGEVNYTFTNWYETTAGLQVYNISGFDQIYTTPLVIVMVNENGTCKEVLLKEDENGALVLPLTAWIQRVEPTHDANFKFLVTQFGQPSDSPIMLLEPCNCSHVFTQGLTVGKPALVTPNTTTTEGKVNIKIPTKEPTYIRDPNIDGQLYGYQYCIQGSCPNQTALCRDETRFKLMEHLIVFRVYSTYTAKRENATWYSDAEALFEPYAVLFPVMKNFLDMGDYIDVVGNREDLRKTLQLPMDDPNFMPVSRDLSETRRDVLLKWLSDEAPSKGVPGYNLKDLRRNLQLAIEVEHATIPPYLTALASIKPSYNTKVYNIIKTVIVQEMLHLSLAANVLNAVGGYPKMYFKQFIADYPTLLPGGIAPTLVIPIEKCTIGLIRNIFMAIETPEVSKNIPSLYYNYNIRNVPVSLLDELSEYCDDHPFAPYGTQSVGDQPRPIIPETTVNYNTIGRFYDSVICSLAVLEYEAKQKNATIFTGDVSRQVVVSKQGYFGGGKYGHGTMVNVTDLDSAVKAIREIVHQGEGASPCNPIAWGNEALTDVSHYYLYESIVEGAGIQVKNESLARFGSDDAEVCADVIYNYTGLGIPLDPDGVWPMTPIPKMHLYAPGSKAQAEAIMFNKVYTRLLLSLEQTFNGNPGNIGNTIAIMHNMIIHLNRVMRTPIDDNGSPHVGPNAGPTFDFTP